VVAAFALTVAMVLAPASGAGPVHTYYVSLGDSLARGWQPSADGSTHDTRAGYVDDVAAYLSRKHPDLETVKFGCGGETTTTMVKGGTCSYSAGSELGEAERFLRSHRGRIAAVTVNIGDNDVESCLSGGSIDHGCVNAAMAAIRAQLPGIAARLRAAAGPGVRIAGLTDYDQFLAYWLRGGTARQFARDSVPVIGALNETVDAIYRKAGVAVADGSDAFATFDLGHRVTLPGRGTVPTAVARVCTWTWACSPPPIGFNDHANATGYAVLGRVVVGALQHR
jgi:lysophospholipase L1-like esterase